MDGGRWRDRLRPWSLDREVWEPRVGEAALRAWRQASWWWLVGIVLAVVNLVRGTIQLVDRDTRPDLALWWLGTALWIGFAVALTLAFLRSRAFDRLVLERHGLPSWSARSLKGRLLRHPEAFDAWVAEQGWLVAAHGAPPPPAPAA